MVNSVNGQTGAVTGIATTSEVDALETRIDNIVAPSGDPSLTEVSDARVGADSAVYSTLKGRIDGEVNELNERMGDLSDLETEGKTNLVAAINEAAKSGLTDEAKTALLDCFEHAAWTNEYGQQYYDVLEAALYPDTPGPTPTPDVPDGYTKYDYIAIKRSGTSLSQEMTSPMFITTPVFPDVNKISYSLKVKPLSGYSEAASVCVFGVRNTGTTDQSQSIGLYMKVPTRHVQVVTHGVMNKSIDGATFTPDAVNTVDFTVNSQSPSNVSINGANYSINWVNTAIINAPIYYFTNPTYGVSKGYLTQYGQIGRFKIYDLSNVLVYDFVPVVRTADGVIGIFDIVNQQFHTCSDAAYATIENTNCKYEVGNWE